MNAPPRIELDNVSHAYHAGAPQVLQHVSCALRPGELVGILGPNGAGKSTLLRVMAGLLAPSSGSVTVDGRPMRTLARAEIARRVAFVPQQEPSVFGFAARELVAMGRSPHTGLLGTMSAADTRAVDLALEKCGATQFAARPFAELSGGEQKRVLIARALAQQAPIVLLDEPVAFLDIKHQLAVCDLLADAVSRGEFTAATVIHDLNLAAQYCHRLMFLRDGAVVAAGPVSDVMTYQQIRATFDTDVYVGENEVNRTRFFVPMRAPGRSGA